MLCAAVLHAITVLRMPPQLEPNRWPDIIVPILPWNVLCCIPSSLHALASGWGKNSYRLILCLLVEHMSRAIHVKSYNLQLYNLPGVASGKQLQNTRKLSICYILLWWTTDNGPDKLLCKATALSLSCIKKFVKMYRCISNPP